MPTSPPETVADPKPHAERLSRLSGLYAIVGGPDLVERARAAIEGGARAVQVRWKDAPSGAVLDAARKVVELARGRALVIVNDRADLALLSGADGVHVGGEDLPVAVARRLVGPDLLVGRTCRTFEEAKWALADGADHVGFGPMFATTTKEVGVPPRPISALREVAGSLGAPVVAISGITLETIGGIAAAGAACAAVIGDLFDRGDPLERARLLAAAFEEGRRGTP
jgi:thiamine-phosphate pyrophosphorylase